MYCYILSTLINDHVPKRASYSPLQWLSRFIDKKEKLSVSFGHESKMTTHLCFRHFFNVETERETKLPLHQVFSIEFVQSFSPIHLLFPSFIHLFFSVIHSRLEKIHTQALTLFHAATSFVCGLSVSACFAQKFMLTKLHICRYDSWIIRRSYSLDDDDDTPFLLETEGGPHVLSLSSSSVKVLSRVFVKVFKYSIP